jgi:DNA-binding transcriptional LysR family regulator
MSYKMESASNAGALKIVLEIEPAPWTVDIVYAGQRLLPIKVRAFLDWVTPRRKARLTPQLGQPDEKMMKR